VRHSIEYLPLIDTLQEAQQAGETVPELWASAWALPEVIEAASRSGEIRLAVEALDPLAGTASVADSDWGWAFSRARVRCSANAVTLRARITRRSSD
jgi:hypothetical protein